MNDEPVAHRDPALAPAMVVFAMTMSSATTSHDWSLATLVLGTNRAFRQFPAARCNVQSLAQTVESRRASRDFVAARGLSSATPTARARQHVGPNHRRHRPALASELCAIDMNDEPVAHRDAAVARSYSP